MPGSMADISIAEKPSASKTALFIFGVLICLVISLWVVGVCLVIDFTLANVGVTPYESLSFYICRKNGWGVLQKFEAKRAARMGMRSYRTLSPRFASIAIPVISK